MLVFNFGFISDQITYMSISSNQTDYSLYNDLRDNYNWDESSALSIFVTVESGVIIDASSTSVAAFDAGNIPFGTYIRLINNGDIRGAGGDGGDGGDWDNVTPALVGADGGDAMNLSVDSDIDNTNGNIHGGGGGGGGGGGAVGASSGTGVPWVGGGGGGGGAGVLLSAGGDGGDAVGGGGYGDPGNPGTVNTPGTGGEGSSIQLLTGGTGGDGGDLGEAGDDGAPGTGGFVENWSGAAGGAAGKAIELNGNIVTWLGGQTSPNVEGAVS